MIKGKIEKMISGFPNDDDIMNTTLWHLVSLQVLNKGIFENSKS